jgi:hypothetical protein
MTVSRTSPQLEVRIFGAYAWKGRAMRRTTGRSVVDALVPACGCRQIAGTSGTSYEERKSKDEPSYSIPPRDLSFGLHVAAVVTKIECKMNIDVYVDRTEPTIAAWSRL